VPAGSKGSYTAKNWGDCFTITDDLPATGTLSVSPTNVSLANTEGSTATVTISSNIHWGANTTSGVAWLTIDPYSAAASSNTLTYNGRSQYQRNSAHWHHNSCHLR